MNEKQANEILCSLTATCHTGCNYDPAPSQCNQVAIVFSKTEMVEFVSYVRRLQMCEKMLRGIADNAPGGTGKIGMPPWEDVRRALGEPR